MKKLTFNDFICFLHIHKRSTEFLKSIQLQQQYLNVHELLL